MDINYQSHQLHRHKASTGTANDLPTSESVHLQIDDCSTLAKDYDGLRPFTNYDDTCNDININAMVTHYNFHANNLIHYSSSSSSSPSPSASSPAPLMSQPPPLPIPTVPKSTLLPTHNNRIPFNEPSKSINGNLHFMIGEETHYQLNQIEPINVTSKTRSPVQSPPLPLPLPPTTATLVVDSYHHHQPEKYNNTNTYNSRHTDHQHHHQHFSLPTDYESIALESATSNCCDSSRSNYNVSLERLSTTDSINYWQLNTVTNLTASASTNSSCLSSSYNSTATAAPPPLASTFEPRPRSYSFSHYESPNHQNKDHHYHHHQYHHLSSGHSPSIQTLPAPPLPPPSLSIVPSSTTQSLSSFDYNDRSPLYPSSTPLTGHNWCHRPFSSLSSFPSSCSTSTTSLASTTSSSSTQDHYLFTMDDGNISSCSSTVTTSSSCSSSSRNSKSSRKRSCCSGSADGGESGGVGEQSAQQQHHRYYPRGNLTKREKLDKMMSEDQRLEMENCLLKEQLRVMEHQFKLLQTKITNILIDAARKQS